MQRPEPELKTIAALPIADLPEGEVGPPLEPDHPTWDILGEWFDPLASRGGYRKPSRKFRTDVDDVPAIEFALAGGNDHDRGFVAGRPEWQDYTVSCRVQQLQGHGVPHNDDPANRNARAGLVFHMATVRWYYFFGIESQQRLVLYRRMDDEWYELASSDVVPGSRTVTLKVQVCGDGIRAECPELGVCLTATDHLIPAGLVGFRSQGQCRLFDLTVAMSEGEEKRNEARTRELERRIKESGKAVPDPEEVAVIQVPENCAFVECTDFSEQGRNTLLFQGPDGLLATTWEGEELWRCAGDMSLQNARNMVFSEDRVGPGRLLYALLGERSGEDSVSVTGIPGRRVVSDEIAVIDGHTGEVLRRKRLPDPDNLDLLLNFDFSFETAALKSDQRVDIAVREWRKDCGGGGRRVWAYDCELNALWLAEVDPAYGHHNAVHFSDVDADGRPELLAGGTLISADGETIWRHDMADEVITTHSAGHYDACVVGPFAGDPDLDPTAFLIGGSAGVYVVDALTGRTRSVHRVGHAQWGLVCKLRPDLPGKEVLVGTRWGNYGILTLFSGCGKRLWSIQPDYVLQGTRPVQWVPDGPQHIWLNTTRSAFGLYDGWGRLVKPLEAMRELYEPVTKAQCYALRPTPEATDHLAIQSGDCIHVFRSRT